MKQIKEKKHKQTNIDDKTNQNKQSSCQSNHLISPEKFIGCGVRTYHLGWIFNNIFLNIKIKNSISFR